MKLQNYFNKNKTEAKNAVPAILLSPLDWGLGHTTRCIPILSYLTAKKYRVFVACEKDSATEKIITQSFAQITILPLKGYHISYAKSRFFFSLKIIRQIPRILSAIRNERKQVARWAKDHHIHMIISDNRYGFSCRTVRSVFITHQLNIAAPLSFAEKIIQKINYRYINHFNECWVPDFAGENNMAGKLSHPRSLPKIPVKYMGPLSRLKKIRTDEKYDFLFLLSGPEPQRTILETRILAIKKKFAGKALLIRGLPNAGEELLSDKNFEIKNYAAPDELSLLIAQSACIVCRSGYSTVMELLCLQKKAVYIPTPGQTEQEYLAKKMWQQSWAYAFDQSEKDYFAQLQNAMQFQYQFPTLPPDALEVFLDHHLFC